MKFFIILLILQVLTVNCFAKYEKVKYFGDDVKTINTANMGSSINLQDNIESFQQNIIPGYENMSRYDNIGLRKFNLQMIDKFTKKRTLETIQNPDFSSYWPFQKMTAYLQGISAPKTPIRYANGIKTAKLYHFGNSSEGRPLYALQVSRNPVFGLKPIIAIVSGMNAREWAAPPTLFYLIHKLVTDSKVSSELLAGTDWLIVPMLNPDGYEYSRTNDRYWAKNRNQENPCIGVDLNRNFLTPERTNYDQCNAAYPGRDGTFEPESNALAALMQKYPNTKLYLDVHTFGNAILYPPGTKHLQKRFEQQLKQVANVWKEAIRRGTGTNFVVGNTYEKMGEVAGNSADYMHYHLGITYSYTLYLTDSKNDYKYPEQELQKLVEETFLGYQAFGRYVAKYAYNWVVYPQKVYYPVTNLVYPGK